MESVTDKSAVVVAPRPPAEPDLVIDLRDPPDPAPTHRRTGVGLLVALNVLNLLDAGLTFLLVRSGVAAEANPFVEWLTLPGKVAFVAAFSVLLWKLRPRALVIPLVGYAGVVAYTIAGALWLG
ncbi:MAG TPA: DUF5658 family protein [Actinomycetota bacterium]|nr:DUF5658 family protein [Actinomycetota bacterium]